MSDNKTNSKHVSPSIFVIFGASGDLTKRKLIPSLFHLYLEGFLPDGFHIVGVARRDLAAGFASSMKAAITEFSKSDKQEEQLDSFVKRISYYQMNLDDKEGYSGLRQYLDKIDADNDIKGNRLYYLSTAPEFFLDIIGYLGDNGMISPNDSPYSRIIIEKPFGHDLESAKKLNAGVNRLFKEGQIFRIDHYLGKEEVQNILVFRFANSIFEFIWNRNHIDHIQITSAESIGVEGRGPFYEKAGAVRDVLQNHIMEVLALVTMEPPISFESAAIRREKLKLWHSIKPINVDNIVRGQYSGGEDGELPYRQEDRVSNTSNTETFVALKMEIDNWRWAGVPIYIRAGKRLPKKATEIVIEFKAPPTLLFGENTDDNKVLPNLLIIRFQPNEGISLRFGAKVPGPHTNVQPVDMDFKYSHAFDLSTATGYERLLLDALLGDQTLFTDRHGVEVTWTLYTPILELWAKTPPKGFPNYVSGSWGPPEADELLKRDGRKWHNP